MRLVEQDGSERLGTIEFGDETTKSISVYCERDGRSTGRVIVDRGGYLPNGSGVEIRPDPGGARPVWASLTR